MRNCRHESDFYLILDPRIKLIWFDKSGAWPLISLVVSTQLQTDRWSDWLFFISFSISSGGGASTDALWHYNDIMMIAMASPITSLTSVYSTVYSGSDQRKHQSSASLSFSGGIHRWPVNFPHKGPVTRKMFPFDDVIMKQRNLYISVIFVCKVGVSARQTLQYNYSQSWYVMA